MTTVEYWTPIPDQCLISVYDEIGRLVMTDKFPVSAGRNKTTLNLAALAAGSYHVTVNRKNGGTKYFKVIVFN